MVELPRICAFQVLIMVYLNAKKMFLMMQDRQVSFISSALPISCYYLTCEKLYMLLGEYVHIQGYYLCYKKLYLLLVEYVHIQGYYLSYKLYLLQGEYVHIHCLILIEGLQVCDSQIRRDLNENSNPVVVTTLEGLPFLFTEKPKYIFHELLTEKHKYIFHELESLIYFA